MKRDDMRRLVRAWLALDGEQKQRVALSLKLGGFVTDEVFMRDVERAGLVDELARAVDAVTNQEDDPVKPDTKATTDYSQLPNFERKRVGVVGVKVVDETQGIVEAFVAGIGNLDDGGDIIQPSFFKSSIEKHLRKNPKGVWSHDWDRWVSKTLETRTVAAGASELPVELKKAGAGGQYVKMQFNLDTVDGRDAFSNVKFFDGESEWSIGYVPLVTTKDADGNRLLVEGAWYEYSPVLFGMNPLTATVGVKSVLAAALDETAHSHSEPPTDIKHHLTSDRHGYTPDVDYYGDDEAMHALHVATHDGDIGKAVSGGVAQSIGYVPLVTTKDADEKLSGWRWEQLKAAQDAHDALIAAGASCDGAPAMAEPAKALGGWRWEQLKAVQDAHNLLSAAGAVDCTTPPKTVEKSLSGWRWEQLKAAQVAHDALLSAGASCDGTAMTEPAKALSGWRWEQLKAVQDAHDVLSAAGAVDCSAAPPKTAPEPVTLVTISEADQMRMQMTEIE